jgi:hypothetical protein
MANVSFALVLNLHQPAWNLEDLLQHREWETKEILWAIDRIPRSLWAYEDVGRVHLFVVEHLFADADSILRLLNASVESLRSSLAVLGELNDTFRHSGKQICIVTRAPHREDAVDVIEGGSVGEGSGIMNDVLLTMHCLTKIFLGRFPFICLSQALLALPRGQKRADHLWPNHSSTAILTTKGRES